MEQYIVDNMNAYLDVRNIDYTYEDIQYTGAQFTIKIPII